MSDEFYMGAYWHDRQLTLRQYADATRSFIKLLRDVHPVFQTLEWVGDRPNSTVKLMPDMANLGELIYQHAGSGTRLYPDANPDGTPSWSSVSELGYGMSYKTDQTKKEGRILISISAGGMGRRTPNSAVIEFPKSEHPNFPHSEFFDYIFLKKLFSRCVNFWRAETGRLTYYEFSKAIIANGPPHVGWLTYVSDPRAAALRNSASLKGLIFETASDGGTLISLGPAMISPDNDEQVENARRLRSVLIDEKILRDS